MTRRVFLDTSVLVRYLAEDDIPRAAAAAELIDSDAQLFISSGVLIELVHALRTQHGATNPTLAGVLRALLSRSNVHLIDADTPTVIAAIAWTQRSSARRIPDAILAAAAEHAHCDQIATFDEGFSSPSVPVRLI